MVACGDDDGGDTGGGDVDGGKDSGSVDAGAGDGGSYTLADALKTDGVDTSLTRSNLLIPDACAHSQACIPDADCIAGYKTEYQRGVDAKYDDACLDATLDLFACFAKETDCLKFETTCAALLEKSQSFCSKYSLDAGTTKSLMF